MRLDLKPLKRALKEPAPRKSLHMQKIPAFSSALIQCYSFSSIHMAMVCELVMGLTTSSISSKTSILSSILCTASVNLIRQASLPTLRTTGLSDTLNVMCRGIAGEQAANSGQASQTLRQDVRICYEELHSWLPWSSDNAAARLKRQMRRWCVERRRRGRFLSGSRWS